MILTYDGQDYSVIVFKLFVNIIEFLLKINTFFIGQTHMIKWFFQQIPMVTGSDNSPVLYKEKTVSTNESLYSDICIDQWKGVKSSNTHKSHVVVPQPLGLWHQKIST